MKCQSLFSGKNKKTIINLSAYSVQRVVKVKLMITDHIVDRQKIFALLLAAITRHNFEHFLIFVLINMAQQFIQRRFK